MTSFNCSLSIMVARTDIPFMMHTIPHQVRVCNFPFSQRLLAVDTAPLTGDKVNRPGIGTMEQLRDYCSQLLDSNVVDKVVDIDYSETFHRQVYQKHFGRRIKQTHNYKGYPILGSLFAIEAAQSDYLLRLDSDMLFYQETDYNWIKEGIKLLQENPQVVAVRPLTGPPAKDGSLHQKVPFERDPNGFYRFKFFSSRAYLIDRKRFDQLLPLKVLWRTYKQKFMNSLPTDIQTWANYTFNKGALDSWEVMVSRRLEETDYVRAVIESPQSWTLHPIDRKPEFIQALPDIIQKIESGWYPPEQGGHYDLILKYWL
ncbi:MAG: glycosyltransferase family 2 protein [Leptolyngbyaceae cyanobacterium SM1_4_3]|nr:glycosyltransferase family 2 protein [Leptolyngbyaceae cyanobacterium SM1_4_3]